MSSDTGSRTNRECFATWWRTIFSTSIFFWRNFIMRKFVLLSVVAVAAFLLAGDQAQAFWKHRCGSSCGTCHTSCYKPCKVRCHKPCRRTHCNRCGDPYHKRHCGLFSRLFKRGRCCHRSRCNTCATPSCSTCGETYVPSSEPVPAPAPAPASIILEPAA